VFVQSVTILGATGSIGKNTLDVIARHPERYRVFAISGHRQVELLMRQAQATRCRYTVLADDSDYKKAKALADSLNIPTEILCGTEALENVASACDTDIVMAAIVGAAGLQPTFAAVKSGKKVLLANKEALVMSGKLFIDTANQNGASLLPIDSEHNAIFQCLPHDYKYGELARSGIRKLILTGSGGPFRQRCLESFEDISPEEACAHPNWSMGKKISVDSATMMNKGLEFIEACRLFGVSDADIDVVLHPQSIIHSMVQYADGSVLSQMGNPDMRTPIAHGLAFPNRIEAGVSSLDFSNLPSFTFETPCYKRYPNLKLAIEAEKQGQSATTALNAANEVAVDAFLKRAISFTQIAKVNAETLEQLEPTQVYTLQSVLEQDAKARIKAKKIVEEVSNRV
jgi:1-deoxy-D-xylulose-5-phosphate reductoisomerase